ncbi:hypothetical protein [Paractinoplanes rishiriensis]|uniref:Uncharacterized protein n=1 Tax=Paractinoplanes rishiriensis TaxID=1050105 RepID=A0A919K8R4_9ACTN|nr:hypothetical protein [Actinoplanes rishiriensis]GIF01805.1 hypothetical protein Ari01nite_92690 [Actinoplanes rishiriensis]
MNEPAPADLDMTVKLTLPTIEPYQQAADATTQFAAITAGAPSPSVYSSSRQPVPAAVGAPPAMSVPGYGMPVSPAVGYGPPMYAYHPAYGPPGPEAVPAYHYPPPPAHPVQKNVPLSFLLAFTGTLAACMLTVTLVLLLK